MRVPQTGVCIHAPNKTRLKDERPRRIRPTPVTGSATSQADSTQSATPKVQEKCFPCWQAMYCTVLAKYDGTSGVSSSSSSSSSSTVAAIERLG